ncbi:hypothetical protein C3K47_06665 [Solitalea longa]|uniref:Uncharacterized protein n=1 Tax=Solitalea longa TaxID=2079460 RepID=A0A2S5A558_9SPHI|nr:hypothetical protein [Solitalea longa]POY37439.1 hypothetical protein C3K47_06665 [Solitalea longa]
MSPKKNKVTIAEAKELIKRYRNNSQKHVKGVKLLNSVDFDLESVKDILNTGDCKGVRAYFTENEENQVQLILVGYDGNNADILPSSTTESSTAQTMKIASASGGTTSPIRTCPPTCTGPTSPLEQ